MATRERPVVVAYDGSAAAHEAVRAAAQLFGDRPLIVATIWEPGLAMAMAPMRDPVGLPYAIPSPDEVIALDRAQHDNAIEVAENGARLARELGASATALPVAEQADPAHTIATLADRDDACAIVVGSRGLGRVASRLLGSVSRELLQCATRPVLVVKATEPAEGSE